jgi:hypothetical protein
MRQWPLGAEAANIVYAGFGGTLDFVNNVTIEKAGFAQTWLLASHSRCLS